jgi:enediyne biosynthesis protein E4
MATSETRGATRSRIAMLFAAGLAVGSLVGLGGVRAFDTLATDEPATAMAAPRFVEEAAAAGIDHAYDGDFPFFVGGGVAAFDCSDDGRPDLYFAGGSGAAALYRNESLVGGALRFVHVPDPATDLTEVVGAYPVDIDGDGILDLAVLRVGENVLLRGLGDCRFERGNEAWGFDGGDDWTAGFSATWEGSSTLPTLAIGNYVDLAQIEERTGCADSELVRPGADGATYAEPIPLTPGWCTLSVLFSDWSRTGSRDLRMANDRHYYTDGEEQLWHIVEGEAPRMYTEDEGWQPLAIWGMGIATFDVTGDGLPEVFLTSQGDNRLQTLVDGATGPTYEDIALERGVTAHRPHTGGDLLPSTAWHPEFRDVNNDGYMDLFISKGNVEAMPEFAVKDPDNLLLGQPDGTFVEGAEAAGIATFVRGRGAALVDLNLDGMLDLVQVNRRENVSLWRNVGGGSATNPEPVGNWVAVRLEQPAPNRDAIGSWITVRFGDRTIEREVTIGGGHAGGQLGWIHVGLGDADGAEIRVEWPDGELGPWLELHANAFATIERGADEARPWTPPGGTEG